MALVGYISVGHSSVCGWVSGSCPGIGTTSSNIPTAHYASSLSTMTEMWVRMGLRYDHGLWCQAPWVVGVGGNKMEVEPGVLVCGKIFPRSDL